MSHRQPDTLVCPECEEQYSADTEFCPTDGFRLRKPERSSEEDARLVGGVLDGQFRIESLIGEGGMGRIYRAEQLSVDRSVAVKTLRRQISSHDVVIERFRRESRVISDFSHPNIVNVIEHGRDDERNLLYLALELVDGVTLASLLERGRLTPPLALHLVSQLCRGLAEVHGQGVVHRDLKPENLMLVPHTDGGIQTKLIDFGVAHAIQAKTNLTGDGVILGTANYMAPEQADGGDVGPYTDVYAVGVMMFEILTGRPPVDGENALDVIAKHNAGKIPRVDDLLKSEPLPDGLSDLIFSMTRPTVEPRPGSILEVRDRLEEIRADAEWNPISVETGSQSEELYEEWLERPAGSPNGAEASVENEEPAEQTLGTEDADAVDPLMLGDGQEAESGGSPDLRPEGTPVQFDDTQEEVTEGEVVKSGGSGGPDEPASDEGAAPEREWSWTPLAILPLAVGIAAAAIHWTSEPSEPDPRATSPAARGTESPAGGRTRADPDIGRPGGNETSNGGTVGSSPAGAGVDAERADASARDGASEATSSDPPENTAVGAAPNAENGGRPSSDEGNGAAAPEDSERSQPPVQPDDPPEMEAADAESSERGSETQAESDPGGSAADSGRPDQPSAPDGGTSSDSKPTGESEAPPSRGFYPLGGND